MSMKINLVAVLYIAFCTFNLCFGNTFGSNVFGSNVFTSIKQIDTLLAEKKYSEAVLLTSRRLNLRQENCLDIEVKSINLTTENHDKISARTSYEQIISLDPKEFAFKSPVYLQSILIHEATHCDQHEFLFQSWIKNEKKLSAYKWLNQISLKDLSQANRNLKENEISILIKGYQVSVKEIKEVVIHIVDLAKKFDQEYGELLEMEAILKTFKEEKSDLIIPVAKVRATDEFAYHFRYLMDAFITFKQKMKMKGFEESEICSFIKKEKTFSSDVLQKYEVVCVESYGYLIKYLDNVPE